MRRLSDGDYTPRSDFPQEFAVLSTCDLRLADWPEGRFMKVGDIARVISCHPETVRRWIRDGKLRAIRIPGNSKNRSLRIDEGDFFRFLEEGECPEDANHHDYAGELESQTGMSVTERRFSRLAQKMSGELSNG